MSKVEPKSKKISDLSMDASSRAVFIQDWVFEAWSDLPPVKLDLLAEEITHIRTVATLMAVLAPGRGLDPELAETIGLLHDAGRLRPGGILENHAECGAAEVSVFLKENQLLSESSQKIAVNAIRRHSAKGKRQDAYDELLKDADVFQRLLEGEPIFSKPQWRKRAAAVLEELRGYAVQAGDQPLVLSPEDHSVGDGYLRFLSEVESWLMLRKHHVLDDKRVHDSRVFIRQTKALQSFFKPMLKTGLNERGQRLLRKALHAFEDARESAVELKAMEAYAASLDSIAVNERPHQWFAERSAALTQGTGAAVAEAGDFSWVADLEVWHHDMKKAALFRSVSEMPLETFTLKRVCRWLRQWRKHYGQLDVDNDTLIHASRIEVKKLRYVIRAVEKLIPAESSALLDALESYQALSGALHDVAMSKTLLIKEGNVLHDGQTDAAQGSDGELSGYLRFREQQGHEYRVGLRSAHSRLTAEIAGWLKVNE